MFDKITILDFGSQYTQLIARRIRKCGAFCEILNFNAAPEKINKPNAIILSGGPSSVRNNPIKPHNYIFKLKIPILAICYGQQILCQMQGGKVLPARKQEYGQAFIHINQSCPLFENIKQKNLKVWMSHQDVVISLPPGYEGVASSPNSNFAAFYHKQKNYYALQFHPEVMHTECGQQILQNFVDMANVKTSWNMLNFEKIACQNIRNKTKNKNIICAVSGGVDSTVTAVLIHKAVDNKLFPIFIDNGLLRENEAKEIISLFEKLKLKLIYKNASELFLRRLKNVSDAETKRKIIGKTFIDVFEKEAQKIPQTEFLAQGTLYPDVIESAGNNSVAATIKSHHNVAGLPKNFNLKLIEPLRDLFKDEVRILGKNMGLKEEFLYRHPFPGPGLAVRVVGAVSVEKLNLLRKADKIFIDELKADNLYDKIWQALAVLLPVKSVGVMGDHRSYEHTLSLRAVTSEDAMTADIYSFDTDFLKKVATRIVNEVRGINRVLYDVTTKPPATIEWE